MPAGGSDSRGYYGEFGGRFVPEVLLDELRDLGRTYDRLSRRRSFRRRLDGLRAEYAGRPTPLFHARRLSDHFGGARIYLKREDLLPTGSHKLNSALGQVLLAESMGKERVLAYTGAGEHGVAIATASALLGLPCTVYMGAKDVRRQKLNVERMHLVGADVFSVDASGATLRAACNEAMRDWMTNRAHSYFAPASVYGPDPYPRIVSDYQQVIGTETVRQMRKQVGRAYPDLAVASIGGGSLAIGLFGAFISNSRVRLVGVEAGGRGPATGEHAARFRFGSAGVLHGMRTLVLQDSEGQISPTYSIAAGLDCAAVGPQHAELAARGRVEYNAASDEEAVSALRVLAGTEGILTSLESAHALAEAGKHARELAGNKVVLVGVSGRGDKDAATLAAHDAQSGRESAEGGPLAALNWGGEVWPAEFLPPPEYEVLEAPAGNIEDSPS